MATGIFCPCVVAVVPEPVLGASARAAGPELPPPPGMGGTEPGLNSGCGFSITQLNAQLGIITSAQKPRLFIIGM